MFAVVLISCMCACNSEEKKDTEKEKVETNNAAGVSNVNGNIPDTTNSIDLTTHRDSSVIKLDSSK